MNHTNYWLEFFFHSHRAIYFKHPMMRKIQQQ